MSIRIMSAIFDSLSLGPTERLIMLALADHADDDGRCYPSMARLSQRTGLSERAIQTNVKNLTDAGYLKVITGGGKSHSNLYFVSANPAADAPRSRCTPAADAPQTPQQVPVNPAADAPEPSITINKPSVVSKKAPAAICAILCEVHGVTAQSAQSFVAYRKNHKSKSLTETAARRLVTHLWAVVEQGGDPSDALGMAEEKGWASIEPHWYFNAKGKPHDNRNQNNPRPARPGDGRGTVDAFAAVAARYAHPTQ